MKSQEILPKDKRINFHVWEDEEREEFGTLGEQIQYDSLEQRILLDYYDKALETAEEELLYWKRKFENLDLDNCANVVVAKERYDKAYLDAEIQTCAGLVCIDLNTVDKLLKIASGYNE